MKAKGKPGKFGGRLLGTLLIIFGAFLGIQFQEARFEGMAYSEAQTAFALAYRAIEDGDRDFAADIVFLQANKGYYNEHLMRELLFGQGIAMRLEGHGDVVKAVAISHDGQYIVSGGGEPWAVSNDNRVLIWDMETGEELAACEGHSNSVMSVAFSPINNTVLSGSRDGTMRLWNWHENSCETLMIFAPDTGIAHRDDTGQSTWIWDVAFMPDGASVVSAGKDGSLIRWDVATGQAEQQYDYTSDFGNRPWVNTVAISPDGSYMVSGADSVSYDGSEAYLLMRHSLIANESIVYPNGFFMGHSHHVISVAINPIDSNLILSASRDGTVRYWNALTGTVNESNGVPNVFTPSGTASDVESVAISPDGTIAAFGTGFGDGTGVREIYLWDLNEWHPIEVFEDLDAAIWDLAFSPDGSRLVAAMSDGTVLVLNLVDRGYNDNLSNEEMLEMIEQRFGN